jgi:hypothetical protein
MHLRQRVTAHAGRVCPRGFRTNASDPAQLTPLKPKVGGAYASVFRCASQKARISKSGLVKIEFARALNENEKEILKVRGFRESRSTRTWTYQSNSFYWGIEDLTALVDDLPGLGAIPLAPHLSGLSKLISRIFTNNFASRLSGTGCGPTLASTPPGVTPRCACAAALCKHPGSTRIGTNPGILTIVMPDLRHELAQCPHRRDMSNPCQVKYVD